MQAKLQRIQPTWVTFAVQSTADALELDQISVGVISQALENISFLRAQNGGTHSRLALIQNPLFRKRPICVRH